MPSKTDPNSLKADWSRYERRAPWSFVSSRELSFVLGVSLNTISNYKMRGILPSPEPHPRFRGNRNWYKISTIKAWLTGRTEEEILRDFLDRRMEGYIGSTDLQSRMDFITKYHKIFDLERP